MIWYIIPSSIGVCIFFFFLGFYIRGLNITIKEVAKLVTEKLAEPEKPLRNPYEPHSEVIDPLDEVQNAIYERDQLLKKMNPE
jgi:hypothetical protein